MGNPKSPTQKPLRASPPEMPTPEHLSKSPAWRSEYLSAKPGSPVRLRSLSSTEIDRLMFLGWLSPDSHTALSKFQKELKDAGILFSVKSSAEPSGSTSSGNLIADKAFSRARKVRDQQKALAGSLSRQEHEIVIDCLVSDLQLNKAGASLMTKAAIILQEVYDLTR